MTVDYVPSVAMIEYQNRWSEIMHFLQMNIIANLQLPSLLQNADKDNLNRLNKITSLANGIDTATARQRVLLELVLGRLVDDFKGYLCEIISNVFRIRPDLVNDENLSKNEKEAILKFYDLQEVDYEKCLAHFLVDKMSNSINVEKYVTDCEKLIGGSIGTNSVDVRNVSEALAVRNLLVHTKGKVNARFLARTGRTDAKIGDRIEFTTEDCQRWDQSMSNLVRTLDRAIVTKIGIKEFVDLHLDVGRSSDTTSDTAE